MREIKFKAYYKADKRIYEVLYLDFASNELGLWDEETEIDFECSFEDVELMQYTGLKDKNGVEIYEGDLFRPGPGYNEHSFRVNWEDEDARFLGIGYGKDSERASGEKYVCYVGVYNKLKNNTVEVIGNIYENTELLQ